MLRWLVANAINKHQSFIKAETVVAQLAANATRLFDQWLQVQSFVNVCMVR